MITSTHFQIHSAWSKAGIGTSIILELLPPSPPSAGTKKSLPRIALDMGATPVFDDAIPAKYVFLSHGHVDHVGAVFGHARAHSVAYGGEAPTYFVPADLLPQLQKCLEAMIALDATCMYSHATRKESLIKCNFVGVKAGDEILLKRIHSGSKTSFFMRAFAVDHGGHPALGYLIGSRTTSGLKEEYKDLDKLELRQLAKSGVKVQADPIESIEVAYSGDTTTDGLILPPSCIAKGIGADADINGMTAADKSLLYKRQLFQAEIILCELTYLDTTEGEDGRRKALERGHLHICDLESIFLSKESEYDTCDGGSSKYLVFYHLSGRCKNAARALDMMAEGIPHQLQSRCQVAISSLLSTEEKNSLRLHHLIQPDGCVSLSSYKAWRDGQN